jgi:O-antigen/teichoic acid export membrane protein
MAESATIAIDEQTNARPENDASMKTVGKHTLIYGLGIVLGKGIAIFMLPIYTRFLTPADYGVLEMIEMTLELISIVAGAQLALGIFRFYHKADSTREKNLVFSTALIALAGSYACVGLMGFVLAKVIATMVFGTADNATLIRIASASLALQSLSTVAFAYSRVKDRSGYFVVMSLIRTAIVVTCNVIFLIGLGWGVRSILVSSLIANGIIGFILSAQLIKDVGLGFSRQATRDLLRYGGPMMATQLATFLLAFGDRFFLLKAGNATVVGLYTLAYQFGFLVAMLGAGPFMRVWDPKRFAVANHPDRDQIYSQGFLYLNLLLITIALVTAVFINDLLRIIVTPAFYPAANLVPIILLAYVLQSWSGIQDVGILIRERTELIMLGNWLAALTALAGYVLLIPRFLGLGAAIATVIAFAVRHMVLFTLSQRLVYVRYDWPPILRLLGAALVAYVVSLTLPNAGLVVSIAMRTVIIAAYLIAVWRLSILSERDRAFVRRLTAEYMERAQGWLGAGAKATRAAFGRGSI